MVVLLFFFEARLAEPRKPKEAHVAPTGRSILAFLREMRGGWREYEMLKKPDNPVENKIIIEKPKPTSLPDLFSLINDEAFGITESEDQIKVEVPQESNISYQVPEKQKISDSQRLEIPNPELVAKPIDQQEVKIKKIVFFYENGKFETFEP